MTLIHISISGSDNGQYRLPRPEDLPENIRQISRSKRVSSGTSISDRLSRISLLPLLFLVLFLLVGKANAAAVAIVHDTSLNALEERDTTANVQLPQPPLDIPQPFDQSIGENFTSTTCPTFFDTFLNDTQFQECYPVSLLLQVSLTPWVSHAFSKPRQTSQEFFTALKSFFWITSILDTSCSVDLPSCSAIMSKYLTKIKEPANCGADYLAENPLVTQAVAGLASYNVLFEAFCLKDNAGAYCFANAITNASKAADTYPYYLPLGEAIPPNSPIDCNNCVLRTMQIFANSTDDADLLSKPYAAAAEQLDDRCGASWVPMQAKTTTSEGISIIHTNIAVTISAFLAVMVLS